MFCFLLKKVHYKTSIFPHVFGSADKAKMPLFTIIYWLSIYNYLYGFNSIAQNKNCIQVPWWYSVAGVTTTVIVNEKNNPPGFKINVYYLLSALWNLSKFSSVLKIISVKNLPKDQWNDWRETREYL